MVVDEDSGHQVDGGFVVGGDAGDRGGAECRERAGKRCEIRSVSTWGRDAAGEFFRAAAGGAIACR